MAKSNPTIISAEPDRQELFIKKEFDAPRELVFKAYTDPAVYAQWLAPGKFTVSFEIFEPRQGGSYRYIFKSKEGDQLAFHGVYHEVDFPARIINSFEFEGPAGIGFINFASIVFEALPGNRTRLTTQAIFRSVADRDNELQWLTLESVENSYARLAGILKTMKKV